MRQPDDEQPDEVETHADDRGSGRDVGHQAPVVLHDGECGGFNSPGEIPVGRLIECESLVAERLIHGDQDLPLHPGDIREILGVHGHEEVLRLHEPLGLGMQSLLGHTVFVAAKGQGRQDPDAAIPAKFSELISLGVASQIPCNYCVYALLYPIIC